VQRLDVLVAVMLARERRAPTEHADGCAPLAASLAALPSRPLEMIAEAVAALGSSRRAREASRPEVADGWCRLQSAEPSRGWPGGGRACGCRE
jgi:hypothetical protein